MIQVHRSDVSPRVLETLGRKQTQNDCDAYDDCPSDYRAGKTFPKFTYYSYPEVKELLLKMHHNKCCYCEMKFLDPLFFDVEHFRPKSCVRQALDPRKHEFPGYYWLKFRWDNLLLSCAPCNRRHKDTCFPLREPLDRARSHHDDLTLERPLLVDPVRQNPRDHIHFVDDNPVGDTPEGETTIAVLGLRRDELKAYRRDLLDLIRTSYQALQLAKEHSDIAELNEFAERGRNFIMGAMGSGSKFSAMVTDYVAQHPL